MNYTSSDIWNLITPRSFRRLSYIYCWCIAAPTAVHSAHSQKIGGQTVGTSTNKHEMNKTKNCIPIRIRILLNWNSRLVLQFRTSFVRVPCSRVICPWRRRRRRRPRWCFTIDIESFGTLTTGSDVRRAPQWKSSESVLIFMQSTRLHMARACDTAWLAGDAISHHPRYRIAYINLDLLCVVCAIAPLNGSSLRIFRASYAEHDATNNSTHKKNSLWQTDNGRGDNALDHLKFKLSKSWFSETIQRKTQSTEKSIRFGFFSSLQRLLHSKCSPRRRTMCVRSLRVLKRHLTSTTTPSFYAF